MTLVVSELENGGYLVEGTDSKGKDGETELHSELWDAVLAHRNHKLATGEFNAFVTSYFAELVDGIDEIKAKYAPTSSKWGTVVITEGSEGVPEVSFELDAQGKLLRIIDEGHQDLLRWINNGTKLVAIR